ncbi:hypothetical protein L3X38_018224 [Prunus dulcis]|uniref:PB1-like domain-containing protein n=1 Tax=Prunus dulcis TaxID=3755 RepID=A0AAD4WAL3_PRUDU|nr:hypothetical protein L3X38_018224 [Prunus dulcis]
MWTVARASTYDELRVPKSGFLSADKEIVIFEFEQGSKGIKILEPGTNQNLNLDDKGLVTFEIHHGSTIVKSQHNKGSSVGGTVSYYDWCPVEYISLLEIYHIAKELGYFEIVCVKGLKNDEWLDIDTDAKLLEQCDLVPLSYQKVVVIYLEDNVLDTNDKPSTVRNLYSEHEEFEGANNEEFVAENNEDSGHGEFEGANNEKFVMVEDSEDSEGQESDPEVVDSAYEYCDEDQCLLEKDDKAFDNYVDHDAPDTDPNVAKEEDDSVNVAASDVKSLDSSSGSKVEGPVKKMKSKLPKIEDFKPKTDLTNPIFEIGLKFPSVKMF